MAKSTAIIAAAKDYDLRERAIAIAAELGMQTPQNWVDAHLFAIAAGPVNDSGDTVASVYEYAQAEYEKKKAELIEPGRDLAIVTDEFLRYSIEDALGTGTSVRE